MIGYDRFIYAARLHGPGDVRVAREPAETPGPGKVLPTDLPRAVRIASVGLVRLSPFISHRYPLERTAEAFATLASRSGVKVIVNPWDGKVA